MDLTHNCVHWCLLYLVMPRRKVTGHFILSELNQNNTVLILILSLAGVFISTKSPASGAGNINEPRLMSQVGRVHEVVCV